MNSTGTKRICPECGLEIPGNNGNQGCIACMLRLAMPEDAAAGPDSSEPPLPPGLKTRFFGDYEILGEIARGGMGVVYRARQLGLNRLVALKMIQSNHLLSAEARLRFGVEIEAVAQLSHPHIVSLFESGEHEGTHFFTMSLIEGGSLAERLKERPPMREFIGLMLKVCRAVHYAHQRGILHRDIKPSNILIDPQGEPHVADFGLAKSIDAESGFTFTSSVLGSPNYMAPEQASGRSHPVTTAVDVYGLGAILYQALAGCPPFQARTPLETMRQVVDTDPVPPRKLSPQTDPDLEVICLKCLHKDPSHRYGTAEDLAQDLQRWLEGRPIQARPLSPVALAWRWSRRHPAVAALALALLTTLVVIAIGVSYAAVQIRGAEQRAATNLRESRLSEARVLRLSSSMGHRDEGARLIGEASALGGDASFRGTARNELLAFLARTEVKFVPGPALSLASDPTLTLLDPRFLNIVTVRDHTNLVVFSVADGTEVRRFNSPGPPITKLDQFSPDGRFLAVRHPGLLTVWDLQTGECCLTREGADVRFCFATHRRRIMIQESPGELAFFNLPSGSETRRWRAPGQREQGWNLLTLAPNGRILAASTGTSRVVELFSPQTGEVLRRLTGETTPLALSWSSDSRSLAVATTDGKVSIRDPETGESVLPPASMPSVVRDLAFDPDRKYLAAGCGDRRLRLFNLASEQTAFEFRADHHRLAFDTEGTRLGPIFLGAQWGWLELIAPTEFVEFPVGPEGLELGSCQFNSVGNLLASGDLTNVVLSDPVSGRTLSRLAGCRITATAFDPRDDSLLMAGTPGLLRFDRRRTRGGRLDVEDRRRADILLQGRGWRAFSFSQDGRWFAAANVNSNAAFVFDYTLTNQIARLGPHPEADSIAISPQGRWVASGSDADRMMRIWDAQSEQMVLSLQVGPTPRAAFSGDGRWLATFGDAFELRETGTWQPAPDLAFPGDRPILGAAAFSPDGRIMAVVGELSQVYLFDLQTFRSIGILRSPDPVTLFALSFSGDGTRLAAVGKRARALIWNLRDIRRSLKRHQLDWDLPPIL